MSKPYFAMTATIAIAMVIVGCETTPPPLAKSLASTMVPATTPSTQPVEVVAELSTIQVTRADLDQLLYESYGLRMLYDIVELRLAKNTLKGQGLSLLPEDIAAERKKILAGIRGEAAESDTENLFNQFLENAHVTRAEFDVKIVQTDACLRKIVTPMISGKLPDTAVHRGYEQMYGAKRRIADITLDNVRDATIARDRVRKEPFQNVALEMSVDPQTKPLGGMWEPFSMTMEWVPQVIRDTAFSMDKGQISDIISSADGKFHIIEVVEVVPPKIVKYDDVKAEVRRQLEDRLITINMKRLREELRVKAQQDLLIDDPILLAQHDALVNQAQGKDSDRETARKKMQQAEHPATSTSAATQP